jgi:hypothetical protein
MRCTFIAASSRPVRLVTRSVLHSLCLLIVMGATGPAAHGREAAPDTADMQEQALDVFLDRMTSEIYIKEQIPFVNYVREVHQADLYVLCTARATGSGDNEYMLTFIGQKAFTGINDTLTCIRRKLDTTEQFRSELARIMKLGLIRYVSRTPQADGIEIGYTGVTKPAEVKDRWDYWVFNVSMRGSVSGEESSKNLSHSAEFGADRVTRELKLNLGLYYDYSERRIEHETLYYTDISRSGGFSALIARSINDHLTYGLFLSGSQSIYSNIDKSWGAAPAIEYNLFPYEETSRRDFRFVYMAGYRHNAYDEETIYYKTEEDLFYGEFSVELDMKTPWGSLSANANASHYFHDFDLNRLTLFSYLYIRILEGFSLNISGGYSAIRDQITLPRRGATPEEVLLQRKELSTRYNYSFSIGFTYRFGSRYSNVINPRF